MRSNTWASFISEKKMKRNINQLSFKTKIKAIQDALERKFVPTMYQRGLLLQQWLQK